MIKIESTQFLEKRNIVLQDIEIEIPREHVFGDITHSYQLEFLCSLAQSKSVLEIGTFRGVATYNLAKIAKSVITIDIDNAGIREGYESYIVGEWFKDKKHDNIKQLIADTKFLDFEQFDEQFDLIFIDGEHSFDGCTNDFMKSLSVLKPNGFIVIDDYDPMWPGVKKAIDTLANDYQFYYIYDKHFIIYE